VVQGHEHPWLLSSALQADDVSWCAGSAPLDSAHFGSYGNKSRYRQADADCLLTQTNEGFDLRFDQPQWAVTPGQSAVLYAGQVCLGGGVIGGATRADIQV
jgi:tRNA-specific 2-thiouridylase